MSDSSILNVSASTFTIYEEYRGLMEREGKHLSSVIIPLVTVKWFKLFVDWSSIKSDAVCFQILPCCYRMPKIYPFVLVMVFPRLSLLVQLEWIFYADALRILVYEKDNYQR